MSTSGILAEPIDENPPQSLDASLQTDIDSPATADNDAPLGEKPASGIRAPRPPNLTWEQLHKAEKEQSAEDMATEIGFSNSGPISPISPLSSSEALRTPSFTDRQRQSYKLPPSPGGASQIPPRMHSPASQIFERDVQEDIASQASPSIPAHIRTENYIPPVLEASSAAITDEQLDPDSVEIVTHSLHQPAAASVTGPSTAEHSLASSGLIDHGMHSDTDDVSSAYGTLDTNDVRRLSFISFADVVNAEHAETGEPTHSREASQGAPTSGGSFAAGPHNRSPSPLRSPASSHAFGTSPPTSISNSVKGMEMSPKNGPRTPGSPLALAQSPVSSHFGGELNVETMRQALRRTGSGDLGGVASQTASAFGNDEPLDKSF